MIKRNIDYPNINIDVKKNMQTMLLVAFQYFLNKQKLM